MSFYVLSEPSWPTWPECLWQDAMVSVEAHIASKMQVDAVFGDLQVLRGRGACLNIPIIYRYV